MRGDEFLKLAEKYAAHKYERLQGFRKDNEMHPGSYTNEYMNSLESLYYEHINAVNVLTLYVDSQLKYIKKRLFRKDTVEYKSFCLYSLENSKLVSIPTIYVANEILKYNKL
jgi:hypothetical protein